MKDSVPENKHNHPICHAASPYNLKRTLIPVRETSKNGKKKRYMRKKVKVIKKKKEHDLNEKLIKKRYPCAIPFSTLFMDRKIFTTYQRGGVVHTS